MNKKFALRALLGSTVALGVTVFTLAACTLSWFLGPNISTKDDEYLDGVVGLRNYFYGGDGSAEKPYEIVSPIHFYNLTRLQNIGVFPKKTYFQLGHDFHDGQGLVCIDDSTQEHVQYLDMESFPKLIPPIGNEGAPFVGTFYGNGIPVKNLTVSGYPEDIGVFGYVSYNGVVDGLVCENLEVVSLGYNPNSSSSEYKLYFPDIDDLFNESAHYLAKDTSCAFYNYSGSGSTYNKTELKHENGAGGTTYTNIDSASKLVSGTKFYNGYFLPTFPHVENDPFSYSWASSSDLIKSSKELGLDLDEDGEVDNLIMIDLDLLSKENSENNNFNSGENMELDARLYLIASITINGEVFSRVIQSYLLEFMSNRTTYGTGEFSVSMYCNYVIPKDVNHPTTNYHHGTNIGFLVGHLDGTLKYSYVYNGKFKFNDSHYHPISTETQNGLVGEVGTNVVNTIDPDFNSSLHGEIGVMNFTGIYDGIRSDFVPGTTMKSGNVSGNTFVYYDYDDTYTVKNKTATSHFDLYKDYLRHNVEGQYFVGVDGSVGGDIVNNYVIPSGPPADHNTVDFLFNKIIQDDYVGDWAISDDEPAGNSKGTVATTNDLPDVPIEGDYYYSTYDAKYYKWNSNLGTWVEKDDEPASGTDKGTIADSSLLLNAEDYYKVSADNKYYKWGLTFMNRGLGVFKLITPRNTNADGEDYKYHVYDNMKQCRIFNGAKDYQDIFFTTAEYDHTISGQPKWGTNAEDITPLRATTLPSETDVTSTFNYPFSRDYNYVFKMDLRQNTSSNPGNFMYNTDSEFLTNYLNSILIDKYGKPITNGDSRFGFMFRSAEYEAFNSLSSYMVIDQPTTLVDYDGHGTYYPSNSIVFNIENENGANVSVVGNGNNISIYKFNTSSTAAPTKLYTMLSENTQELTIDSHRYFSYDYESGATSTLTVPNNDDDLLMDDGDALYAHIFKLPHLPDGWMYAIGAAESNKKANLYYLAVQGQTEGTIGSVTKASVGNIIENVDFLISAPDISDYPITSLSPNGYVNKEAFFTLTANFNTAEGIIDVVKYGETSFLNVTYNNDPRFMTYLFTYDYKNNPEYYINGTKHTRSTETIVS